MKKIILLILDGFGLSEKKEGNAIAQANTKVLDELMSKYPCAELKASGEEVGLPEGQMGNSEVGHFTIGCGRVVPQALLYLNNNIKNKEIFKNEFLKQKMQHVKDNNSTLHLIGLLSNGGVHSSIQHFYSMIAMAKLEGIKKVSVHAILDGRDTPPSSALNIIKEFKEKCAKLSLGNISTVCGRYYAMDRDNHWDRIKKYYDLITRGVGSTFASAEQAIEIHYRNKVTDEFINPSFISGGDLIKDNDTVIFLNFRPDRMKQIVPTFIDESFNAFPVKKYNNTEFCSLYKVCDGLESAYEKEEVKNTFGEYMAELGFRQARIAETEKYNHVTYFFDAEKNLTHESISKFLSPSPSVPTYDKKPEMSIGPVTQSAISAMEDDFDFILVNFANPDMVGHTGNFNATVDAIEICDFCVGKLYEKAKEQFYNLIITADHGNAEEMIDNDGSPKTSHTTNKVPFIICNSDYKIKPEGTLKDIIPTIIDMYKITKPVEMTGESLLIEDE